MMQATDDIISRPSIFSAINTDHNTDNDFEAKETSPFKMVEQKDRN